ncbi:hypothetical protein GPECTOR_21g685 [Gonium pectorale]|uniref:Uncharacterized protein n=1 Tax=Gonium pectorale TaxID=33097 RepID=A0A150GI29_GONPE|nr:hypothetical protein GPECTOR_21g685 [Gonium pectorale]|eukprot:KXZ49459.1 hypothetical protein GPECTOR_21g685 [Gonium pectorale]
MPRDGAGAGPGSSAGLGAGSSAGDAGAACGFRTAAERPIHTSAAARQRASSFWAKLDAELEAHPPVAADKDEGDGAEAGVAGLASGAGGFAAVDGSGGGSGGFTFASGRPAAISAAARQRGASFMAKVLSAADVPEQEDVGAAAAAPLQPEDPQHRECGSGAGGTAQSGALHSGPTEQLAATAASPRENPAAGEGDGGGAGGGGFKFASGKAATISAAARQRGALLMAKVIAAAEEAEQAGTETSAPNAAVAGMVYSGFSTGSGRQVTISAAARQRAAGFLAKVMENDEEGGPGDGASDGAAIAAGALAAAEPPPAAGPGPPAVPGPSGLTAVVPQGQRPAPGAASGADTVYSGFSTGSGRQVTVSAAARKRAAGFLAKVLDNDDEDQPGDEAAGDAAAAGDGALSAMGPHAQGPGPSAALGSLGSRAAAPEAQRTAAAAAGGTGGAEMLYSGFSTGSGRQVNISAEARKRAAGLLAKVFASDEQDGSGDGAAASAGAPPAAGLPMKRAAQPSARGTGAFKMPARVAPPRVGACHPGATEGATAGGGGSGLPAGPSGPAAPPGPLAAAAAKAPDAQTPSLRRSP